MAVKKKDTAVKAAPKPSAALKSFLSHVEKKYGPDSSKKQKRDFIESSSFKFNRIMGGGWLRGRIYELFGPEGGGKTTLALDAVHCAQVQLPDLSTLYIDKEHGLDDNRMTCLGVDLRPDRLVKDLDPQSGDEALQMLLEAIQSNAFSVVVLDSIAILEPKEEQGVDIEEAKNKMGLQGKMMSTAMRKIVQAAFKHNVCVIFINQLRDKLNPYGPKEDTPGGRAVKFAASVRINVHPKSGKENKYMKDGELIGHKLEMQTVKNKLAPPMRTAEIDLYYLAPLDTVGEVMSLAIEHDIIVNQGRTYFFNDQKIATSGEALREALINDHELRKAVSDQVQQVIDKVVTKERSEEKIDLDTVPVEEIPEDVSSPNSDL